MKVLIVSAHPEPLSFNTALRDRSIQVLTAAAPQALDDGVIAFHLARLAAGATGTLFTMTDT